MLLPYQLRGQNCTEQAHVAEEREMSCLVLPWLSYETVSGLTVSTHVIRVGSGARLAVSLRAVDCMQEANDVCSESAINGRPEVNFTGAT